VVRHIGLRGSAVRAAVCGAIDADQGDRWILALPARCTTNPYDELTVA
jgi:hypothetical protein